MYRCRTPPHPRQPHDLAQPQQQPANKIFQEFAFRGAAAGGSQQRGGSAAAPSQAAARVLPPGQRIVLSRGSNAARMQAAADKQKQDPGKRVGGELMAGVGSRCLTGR